ncbi:MAG: RNA polymerase sigma factor [Bacteroidales bacterium]|nr:RNA polymerase sigma factor [Bacteroidales bacterium]
MSKEKAFHNYSDAGLMTQIRCANTLAFNELYSRYSRRMLYYFYRMLGNCEDTAQDFLQDLFYKIVDKPHLYNPAQKFSTWIFCIAHNMCKNEYRRRNVRQNIRLSSESFNDLSEKCETENDLSETINLIYRELDHLGESHKTAFILRYREGFQVNEISEVLNLPEGTVKSRLFYARRCLVEKLKKHVEMMY